MTIARASHVTDIPARFMLAVVMNPCPCGYYGSGQRVPLLADRDPAPERQ
jgi:magnesium chelatase family protein